jgi:hypothetical protein
MSPSKINMTDKRPLRIPRDRWIEEVHTICAVPKDKKPEARSEIITTLAPIFNADGSTLLCFCQHRPHRNVVLKTIQNHNQRKVEERNRVTKIDKEGATREKEKKEEKTKGGRRRER